MLFMLEREKSLILKKQQRKILESRSADNFWLKGFSSTLSSLMTKRFWVMICRCMENA